MCIVLCCGETVDFGGYEPRVFEPRAHRELRAKKPGVWELEAWELRVVVTRVRGAGIREGDRDVRQEEIRRWVISHGSQ